MLKEVALVRHQKVVSGRPTPFSLWATDRSQFELFQSMQNPKNQSFFSRPYWASFIVPPDGSTLFAGIYQTKLIGVVPDGTVDPVTGLAPGADKKNHNPAHAYDLYETTLLENLSEYIGRIKIEWGTGFRGWMQTASKHNKEIVELSIQFQQPNFPGFAKFVQNLGELASIPETWITALASVRGVYLLTCPRTKEQYVGKASGERGFWGRWQQYIADGTGGNVGLKSRDPSDYQVSILEVSASTASESEIGALEDLWKRKLQSREMGLNRN